MLEMRLLPHCLGYEAGSFRYAGINSGSYFDLWVGVVMLHSMLSHVGRSAESRQIHCI